MKQIILTVIALFFTSISSPYASPKSPSSLVSRPSSSYYAVWAATGEPIAAHQEKLPLNPASTAKLITTYCALKELGPNHQFETKFYSEGPIQNGAIQNLWVKGEGDPSLVSEVLWEIAQKFASLGLRKILGNIYVDASYFDALDYPGRQENNERAYNAPVSALSINFNSVEAEIASQRGKLILSILPNAPTYLKIQNNIRLGGKRANITIQSKATGDSEIITLGGRFPTHADPITFYRSIKRPAELFGHALAAYLKENGIEFNGTIKPKTQVAAHLLLNSKSKPLSAIAADMNKFSNNFIAEQITKHLGAKAYDTQGTTEKGITVLKNCLTKTGIETSNLLLENGSGLSYDNKVTAEQLVRVLTAGYQDSRIKDTFISSLSVNGVDGTMKSRRSPDALQGILRAKTGSLNGISTLAGFAPAADGNTIAFVILMNDFWGSLGHSHKAQDALVLEWMQLKKR